MTAVAEHIKRMMGWCPKKDYTLAQTSIETYEHSNVYLANTDVHRGKGTYMIVDYLNIYLLNIILLAAVASFVLIIVSLIFPILRFSITLPLLAAFAVLLYQERAYVEFTPNSINIQKPLFKPVLIPKASIQKFKIVKNFSYTMRWILPLLVVIMLINLRIRAINIFNDMTYSPPFYFVFVSVLGQLAIGMMMSVLLYKFYIRKKYPRVLKIILKGGSDVIFYADNPQELMDKLEARL